DTRSYGDWSSDVCSSDLPNPMTQPLSDQIVFEGGCGKGRHTAIVSSHGARAVVSLDLGESAFVAFAHTRRYPDAHVIIGDLLKQIGRASCRDRVEIVYGA